MPGFFINTGPLMNSSGVYIIRNTDNGKCYVGSAVNFRKRWTLHKCNLRKGAHHSPHLQSSWNKHGEAAFTFDVLETTPREDAVKAEQRWIDRLKPEYNMSPTAGSALGTTHTEATKAKIAASRAGRKHTDAAKAKISQANSGRKHTPETCAKNSAAQKGKHGIKHTAETRARMSTAAKARPPRGPISEETRAKRSAALKGKKRTDETRARMSASAKARAANSQRTERGTFV